MFTTTYSYNLKSEMTNDNECIHEYMRNGKDRNNMEY